ncbi:unnamed protein product [Ilex paraguariensis]|uniref:Transmembrane protein n=1 Tax=Ilex paraguariensis TaxID=185542 RepID=A0ABC8RAI7_9AQUA
MEKQVLQEKFITKEPQASLGTLGILWAALRIGTRNGKLLVSIMIYVSISFSLLTIVRHLALTPILTDLSSKLTSLDHMTRGIIETDETLNRGIIKDVVLLLLLQSVILVFSCSILVFSSVATISSTYEAYTAKVLTLKDTFLMIRGRWTRPIITSFYATLLSFSMITLFSILVGVFSVISYVFSLILLNRVVAIFEVACYIYLAAVFMFCVVVSIVEADSGGLKAIHRARELMKGKTLKGSVLMLIFLLASGTVSIISLVLMRKREKQGWVRLAIQISGVWALCLAKISMFVVFTVFYHECRKSHEEVGVEGEEGLYVAIHSGEA